MAGVSQPVQRYHKYSSKGHGSGLSENARQLIATFLSCLFVGGLALCVVHVFVLLWYDGGIVTCGTQYLLHEWHSIVVILKVPERALPPWSFGTYAIARAGHSVGALDPNSLTCQQRFPKVLDNIPTTLRHKGSLAPEQNAHGFRSAFFFR